MHTSPLRWSNPNTGGLSPARVPRPRLPRNRRLRPFRPAFRTWAGSPLCPATIYTSSASISPLSWTGFFLPQFLDAVGWSSSGHRRLPDPTPQQSVRSRGSSPSSTDTAPRPAMVDDVLQKLCHSDHQIVAHTPDTDTVGDGLDAYENHVSSPHPTHIADRARRLASAVLELPHSILLRLSVVGG
jgi:hypothetical protein